MGSFREELRIEAPLSARVIGLGQLAFILIAGIFVVAHGSGGAIAAVAVLWVPLIYRSLRFSFAEVAASDDLLAIRNPWRTYRLHWAEIADIRFKKVRPWAFGTSDRWAGIVTERSGSRIELVATESYRWLFLGRVLSQSKEAAELKVFRLRDAWHSAAA